jgi:hypothetical protein
VVESTPLLRERTGNRTEGSNPSRSAILPIATVCSSLFEFKGYSGLGVYLGVAWLTILYGKNVGTALETRPFSVTDRTGLNPARLLRRKARFHGCYKAAVLPLHQVKICLLSGNFPRHFQRFRIPRQVPASSVSDRVRNPAIRDRVLGCRHRSVIGRLEDRASGSASISFPPPIRNRNTRGCCLCSSEASAVADRRQGM